MRMRGDWCGAGGVTLYGAGAANNRGESMEMGEEMATVVIGTVTQPLCLRRVVEYECGLRYPSGTRGVTID